MKEAVDKQRELANADEREPITLSTGVKAYLNPVAVSLVEDIGNAVEPPPVPTVYNEAKGREEPNPNHPQYLQDVRRYNEERAMAMADAAIVFGLDLVDGAPDDDTWIKKLQFVAKRSSLDLSAFDLDDPFDREFVYKKYVAVGSQDLVLVMKKAGLGQEDVDEALETFPSS